MSDLNPEAKALRERISRYSQATRQELNQILRIEFQFVQLLDVILQLYPLDAHTYKAIAYLEESRTWAGLSVKRGRQQGYQPSDYSPQSQEHLTESEPLKLAFEEVLKTILSRCVPNREMDLAIARLDEAKSALNL
jgi:hypothetical protein